VYKHNFANANYAPIERDGAHVVSNYIYHSDFYSGTPGIETQLTRLIHLVGLISDKAGINLLEIIDKHSLDGVYEFIGKQE
jgi:hypothetical protein